MNGTKQTRTEGIDSEEQMIEGTSRDNNKRKKDKKLQNVDSEDKADWKNKIKISNIIGRASRLLKYVFRRLTWTVNCLSCKHLELQQTTAQVEEWKNILSTD